MENLKSRVFTAHCPIFGVAGCGAANVWEKPGATEVEPDIGNCRLEARSNRFQAYRVLPGRGA